MRQDTDPPSGEPAWPYASLLIFGTFGRKDEAAKRAGLMGWPTMALLMAGTILINAHEIAAVYVAGIMSLVGAVGLIVWTMARYLRSLDEMNRLIQLESFAWAYAGLLALAIVAFGIGGGGRGDLLISPFWILVGESLRGIALVFIARRYR